MALKKSQKGEIIKKAQVHDTDTGSSSVQVGLLTEKINKLADHLKKNKKDNHSRRGLLKMVAQRRKLVDYLKKTDEKTYKSMSKKFGLKIK